MPYNLRLAVIITNPIIIEGGVGADFAWSAFGLIGFRFGLFGEDNARVFAGYRALSPGSHRWQRERQVPVGRNPIRASLGNVCPVLDDATRGPSRMSSRPLRKSCMFYLR